MVDIAFDASGRPGGQVSLQRGHDALAKVTTLSSSRAGSTAKLHSNVHLLSNEDIVSAYFSKNHRHCFLVTFVDSTRFTRYFSLSFVPAEVVIIVDDRSLCRCHH